tara:strand:- start:5160 stop:6500 length:1341 start_codon:yes stop_codon:yes gene_type:complete
MPRTAPLARSAGALAALIAPPSLAAPASAETGPTVLHIGTLYAVPGEAPIRQATVVVVGDTIDRVLDGYRDPADLFDPGVESRTIDLKDRFVVPGLMDCHTHLTGQSVPVGERMRRQMQESEAYAAIDGVVYAHRTLMAGFTTVRNVGSGGQTGLALRDRINQGMIPGPRMLVSGPSVTVTGGHGDGTNSLSPALRPDQGPETAPADGPAEVRRAVRARVREGVDLIKITATGGVLSMTAAGVDQQFFDDELESIVEAARMMGRKVAAHAHGANGINAALRAGVDSIEHGTYLDDESIELFIQTGAYLVPTIHAGKYVEEKAKEDGYYPMAIRSKAAAVGPVIQGAFGRAHKAGVKVAFGTDVGVGNHGTNALEFVYMHEAGMSPEDCLKTATINAADLIGVSDKLGTIESGKLADLVGLDSDPMQDVTAYQRVVFVMKDGSVYKE